MQEKGNTIKNCDVWNSNDPLTLIVMMILDSVMTFQVIRIEIKILPDMFLQNKNKIECR